MYIGVPLFTANNRSLPEKPLCRKRVASGDHPLLQEVYGIALTETASAPIQTRQNSGGSVCLGLHSYLEGGRIKGPGLENLSLGPVGLGV